MAKKLIITAIIIFFLGVSSGCCTSENDRIEIWNKSKYIFDDINIQIKDGYFYDKHEKFMVDDNTIGVTIFFVNENGDEWKVKE